MNNALCWLLLTVPFIHLVFHKFDIWTTQGYFFQFAILSFFSYRIFKKNRPFGALIFWLGSMTFYVIFAHNINDKSLPIYTILPFFNFLTVVIFYELCVENIKRKDIIWLADKYFYVIMILSIYGVMQFFQLDQFYRSIWVKQIKYVVGTIGNPMHFSHFIAIISPLLFLLPKKKMIIGFIFSLLVILLTGSATGLACLLMVLLIYLIIKRKKWLILLLIISIIPFMYIKSKSGFFANNYRFEGWGKFLPFFMQKPITGWGLGIVRRLAIENDFKIGNVGVEYLFSHTHCEYLNLLIEGGMVGLLIVFWGIINYFKLVRKTLKDDVILAMALMFTAFLFCSLFGFPAHLWVMAGLGILAYSYVYRKEMEDKCALGLKSEIV